MMEALDTVQFPFSVAWVREAIESLGGRYGVPSESKLEWMATQLNWDVYMLYSWKERISTSQARVSEVRNALKVLTRFHEDRQKELEAVDIPPHLVERETQLRDKFNAYMETMSFMEPMSWLAPALPMDAGLVFARLKSWRDIAENIADVFVQAMKESNPGRTFGFSDDGPAVKFTLAALERIGAAPRAGSPENARYRIAQRIRELKAKKKRKEKPDL
jgi:hypothetical protein